MTEQTTPSHLFLEQIILSNIEKEEHERASIRRRIIASTTTKAETANTRDATSATMLVVVVTNCYLYLDICLFTT